MGSQPTQGGQDVLMKRALRGEAEAFWELIRPWERLIYAVAIGVVKDREKAEDVVQDTYVRAFSTLGNLRTPSKLSGWLYSMARNIAYEHLRKTSRQRQIAEKAPTPEVVPISSLMIKEEESQLLDRCLNELPEAHRVVLGLKYMNNLACKEIAETLGIGLEAAKSRLFEARRALRARMIAAEKTAASSPAQMRGVQTSPADAAQKKVL